MKTCVVLVTHNRFMYTKKCLEHILADCQSDFDLHIWDNASTDGTPEFLESLQDKRIREVVLSGDNSGPLIALNRIWSRTTAEFVAKVDNDCLVTAGWLDPLTAAHRDCDMLGAVACWHYRLEDFDESLAAHKMRYCNGHGIFQHPWVCGSGFVMKRRTYIEMGPWPEGINVGATGYFLKMARRGYVNGWYYPLILQHHMEDPFSPYCSYRDDASLQQAKAETFTLRENNINTFDERLLRRKAVLENLLCGSPNARDYLGWRGRLRRYLPAVDRWRQRLGRSINNSG